MWQSFIQFFLGREWDHKKMCLLDWVCRLIRKYNCFLTFCPLFLTSFHFSPNDSPSKLWKMFFMSSKKLFSFSRYSNFVFQSFPLFLPVSHFCRTCSKINLKVYHIINCLNKNLITHFIWYYEKEKRYDIENLSIDRVLDREHFHGKIMQKMCSKS